MLNLMASYSPVTGLSFSLQVNAKLNLTVNGTNLFSFSVLGFIQVNSSGLVAALTINLAAGTTMPSGLGFTLSATFMLEINTTGSAVTVPGTSVTVAPGALVAASGSLSIPGFTITGEFDLTVSSSNLLIHVSATVKVLGITFSVVGYAGVYYDTDPGFALSLTLKVGTGSGTDSTLYPVSSLGNLFVIQGTLTLQINTCAHTRTFTDPVTSAQTSIASGFIISISNLRVYLFGFNLTGSASFGLTSAGLNISLNLSLSFFGMTFSFNGYVNADGSFSITASARFEYDWSIKIFSGEVYAYFSITFSNTGFAASAGCGIHVDGIGSLSASASVFISGSEFKMDVDVDIGICDVTVHIDLGTRADPPAPPPTPVLATQTGGTLVLNLGSNVGDRGSSFGAVSDENYVLTGSGGNITVTALGYSETYSGITDIVVNNTAASGTNNVTINIANSITATEHITLGSVNNNITTGGGFATIKDYGTGSNSIHAGTGGGVYMGGQLNGSGAYANKGESSIFTSGNFSVNESGYSNYSLSTSVLQYGSFLLDLSGVTTVTLNAVAGTGAHTFTMAGWSGTVNIVGQGNNNTINVNPLGGTSAASFVLADAQLKVTVGSVTSTYNLSDIQTANLTGDAKGANTYTVTGWTGNGSLTGPSGSTNTVISTNDRDFTLTNTSLARSGLPTLTLSNIQNATLTGGASANTFTVHDWSGNATLTGIGGNETYNITLSGTGSGTITVSDATPNSNDVLNLYTGASTTITASQLKVVSQLVNYSGVKTLNINGTTAGLTYNIQATNSTTTTTINVTGTGNVFNIGSTAGISPAQPGQIKAIAGNLILNGSGQDVLNVDDTGYTFARTGILTATTLNFTGLGTITYSGISGITISLGQGGDTFTIMNTITSTATLPVVVINGDGGDDTFYIVDMDAVATVNGGDGNDTFNILGTSAVTTVNGGNGNDTFNVFRNSATLNLNGEANDDTFNIFASIANDQQSYNLNSLLNVDGGAGVGALNIYGTELNDAITIDGELFTSVGLDVSFGNIANWNVYGLGGNDTFYVKTVVVTTLLAGDGSVPTFTVPAGVTAPDLTTGVTATSFNDTFYIGWRGASTSGSLDGINAVLTIQGNAGTNAAYVDDSANTADQTFTLTPTTMNSTAMGANGQIVYGTLQVLNVLFGSGNDTLALNDMSDTTATTVDGGLGNNSAALNFSGDFAGTSLVLLNFQTASLSVGGNFSGTLTDAGAFTTVHIGGSMTSTGVFNAGSVDTMTVGEDLAGLLNVTGLLNTLAIGGGSPGKIVAGSINFITVQAGYGNKVLQVIEGGIERQIQAVPVAGGTLASTILFTFIYDSSGAGDPQLAMLITNNGVVVPHSFNLAVVVIGSNAQFNLALVDAPAATGLSNLTISGDILFSANTAELNFLGVSNLFGVELSHDNITGVEVSGILPIGYIDVAGIEGVAFGLLENSKGQIVPILGDLGSKGKPQVLWNLLGSHATLLAATDALTVSFNENHSVEVFAQCNSDFTFEYVMTLTDEIADGAPINAVLQIHPGNTPAISNLAFRGDGAGVDSRFDVANITSTGSIGDVTVRAKAGLGSLTASSIFGNINILLGAITGTIQTTGVRIDPLTGDQTTVNGDIGQFTFGKTGAVNGITTISAKLGITGAGQIIVRGNLISSVKVGTFSGLIAVQGDIGVVMNAVSPSVAGPTSPLTRFGGISITGNASGQIIALGNAFGDILVTGTLSGRIAVQGQPAAGLTTDRDGILGNVTVSKFGSNAAVISGGLIGDVAGGTAFKSGAIKSGILAADGNINLAKGAKVAAGSLFGNSFGTPNGAVIDAIFTDNSSALQFDTGGTLAGLALIQADLHNVGVTGGNLAGTTP